MLTGKFIIEHIRAGVVIERMEVENSIDDKGKNALIEVEYKRRDSTLKPAYHFWTEVLPGALIARFNFPKPITMHNGDELHINSERPLE